MSQIDVLEELKKHPEGRSVKELVDTLGLVRTNIVKEIYKLRKTFIIESQRIQNNNPTVRYILKGVKYDHENRNKDSYSSSIKGKELEKHACRTFVCSHIDDIDIKGKELGLNDNITKLAKELATEYFKKTYHKPKYYDMNRIIPAFIHIATNLMIDENGKRIYIKTSAPGIRTDLAIIFDITLATMSKWNRHICEELDIERR